MACSPWAGHLPSLGFSFHSSNMGLNVGGARFPRRAFLALKFSESTCIHQKLHKTHILIHEPMNALLTSRVPSPFLLNKRNVAQDGGGGHKTHFSKKPVAERPLTAASCAMQLSFKPVICQLPGILVPFSMPALACCVIPNGKSLSTFSY